MEAKRIITSIKYSKIIKKDKILSPIETHAKILAKLASFGSSSPFNLAMAFAFFAITRAIIAGIKLNIQTKKKEASETMPKIIAI